MRFNGEIQDTRYEIQDVSKNLMRTDVSISCILYLRILYLFDKPQFSQKKTAPQKRDGDLESGL